MGAIMRQWALLAAASAFVAPPRHELGRAPLRSTPNTNNPEELDEASMTELRLRMSRESLENRYRTSVTRRKRAWLPYDAAAAWARRLGLATEDDWRDWLEQGEGRSSYVPSKPVLYLGMDDDNGKKEGGVSKNEQFGEGWERDPNRINPHLQVILCIM